MLITSHCHKQTEATCKIRGQHALIKLYNFSPTIFYCLLLQSRFVISTLAKVFSLIIVHSHTYSNNFVLIWLMWNAAGSGRRQFLYHKHTYKFIFSIKFPYLKVFALRVFIIFLVFLHLSCLHVGCELKCLWMKQKLCKIHTSTYFNIIYLCTTCKIRFWL